MATAEISSATTAETSRNPASDATQANLGGMRLLYLCLQLALVLFVIWRYELESRTFFNVMLLVCGGFVIHSLLPLRYRLSFFVALSLATIAVALGPVDGIWLVALGLTQIGICHLRLRLARRIGLLLLVAALFAAFRVELIQGPWSIAIWPILGSMFMFRLALYLHALEHDEKHPTPTRTLAYFFMLPNVCFPLYPVIDYQNFRRNYYDRAAPALYDIGLRWIVRGLVQLILYRYVYLFLSGDATRLNSLGDLVQFLLATFLLYLRVSGQFHFICGVLYLFGFRLPETHHLYFLASSFTDFWRRINIYWKDFMMKLFYYPAFFRLKRFGPKFALVTATIAVFFSTWILHSYQWFWLRGGFPLEPQDGLFWGLLGILVVMGSLRELRASRPRRIGNAPVRWSFTLAVRTVATFSAICILWSLWSSESIVTWLLMWTAAANTTVLELLSLGGLLAAGFAIAGWPWQNVESQIPAAGAMGGTRRLLPTIALVALLSLSVRDWYAEMSPSLASVIGKVQTSTLNARDLALKQKGYYENLDNKSRMSAQLWDVTAQKPAHWGTLSDVGAYQVRNDFLRGELRPNVSVMFNDALLTTNSWGMRDRERPLEKPDNTYRIAFIGPSFVMGSGNSDLDTIPYLLEKALNGTTADKKRPKIEVLNFGVAAYALTQQLALFEERVLRFRPDVVVFSDSSRWDGPVVQHILHALAYHQSPRYERLTRTLRDTGVMSLGEDGIAVPFEIGRTLAEGLGFKTRIPWVEAEQRLFRSADDLLRATLDEMTSLARKHGVAPVFLGLDVVSGPPDSPPRILKEAEAAGMIVFDLFGFWKGCNRELLRIAPWDDHPNAIANRQVANHLAHLLQSHAPALGIPLSASIPQSQECSSQTLR